MNKILSLATVAVILFSSCGDSKKNEAEITIPGMKEISLKINANEISILVPDSTYGKLEVINQPWGATEISVGKDFRISVSEGEGDFDLLKSDIAGNEVNKFRRFLKNEPDLLVWESEITEPEFHFYTRVKANKVSIIVEDIKDEHFNEKAIDKMVQSAKSIKGREENQDNKS